jgi:hypothetical protein
MLFTESLQQDGDYLYWLIEFFFGGFGRNKEQNRQMKRKWVEACIDWRKILPDSSR